MNIGTENVHKDRLVNGCEEFSNVALEHPAGAGIIFRYLASEGAKAVHRSVRALPYSAGIGVGDEQSVKEWVEDTIEGVVQEPVAHARFVDVTRLRVANFEMLVRAVLIRSIR